jgi:hypothetical protein
MTPVELLQDHDVAALAAAAAAFLANHTWCRRVVSGQAAWAAGKVLGVFQFTIEPLQPNVDAVLWVVAGDVPPAYLVLDDVPTWREALEAYVDLMDQWVDAARAGLSVEGLVPVDVAPTREHAELLDTRLRYIREEILAVPVESLENDV